MNQKFWVLGDVHLGKVFRTGVTPDRRGQREDSVFRDFEAHLRSAIQEGRSLVQVGDLFDTFRVPNEILLRTAKLVRNYADQCRRDQCLIFIAGNHDEAKDKDKVSSFELFAELVAHDNVVTVRGDGDVFSFEDCLFVGFNAFRTPAEQLADYDDGEKYDAVFGHWDVIDVGKENPQLAPFDLLRGLTTTVVTGHDHTPRELAYGDDFTILVTGSMQPYSHAEDPDEEIYVTRSAEDVLKNPTAYRNKFLRVALKPDETFDRAKVDALAVTFKHLDAEGVEVDLTDIDLDAVFDFATEVKAAFKDVPEAITSRIQSMLEEARNV